MYLYGIKPIKPGNYTQEFFDNYIIEDMSGIRRRFFSVEKDKANPVMTKDREWEEPVGPGYISYLKDEEQNRYLLWYDVPVDIDINGIKKRTYYVCHAQSKDLYKWEKPVYKNGYFENCPYNSIVARGNLHASGQTVVENPDKTDAQKKYIMVYDDMGVKISFSPDGIKWTEYEKNPVIKGMNDTHLSIVYCEQQKKWFLYIRPNVYAGHWKRRIAVSVSNDLESWTQPSNVLIPQDEDEFYDMPVFKHNGIFIGLLHKFYSSTSSTLDVELAYSRDGITWQRTYNTVIPLGNLGEFDSYYVSPSNLFTNFKGKLMTLYRGSASRHNDLLQNKRSAIGIGWLRKDGFVCLDCTSSNVMATKSQASLKEDNISVKEQGVLLTRPFIMEGSKIVINAWAPNGYVNVEIIDVEKGLPHLPDKPMIVKGPFHENAFEEFTEDKFDTFKGDSTCHTLSWNGRTDLSSLDGRCIRLKLTMWAARLYSFTVCK